jgi:hypothetical protein
MCSEGALSLAMLERAPDLRDRAADVDPSSADTDTGGQAGADSFAAARVAGQRRLRSVTESARHRASAVERVVGRVPAVSLRTVCFRGVYVQHLCS